MAGVLTAAIAAAFAGGVTADPYYEYTTLLLPGTGTNGAQNNTFLDGSTNNFTITRNGNTTQGTFSPFSQTGWGNYFNGSSQYLSTADNAAFTMGSGDFTIEYWTYFLGGSDLRVYGQFSSSAVLSTISFFGGNSSGNKVLNGVYSGSTGYTCTSTADIPTNQWVHIAFVRDGNTLRQYINGNQDGTSNVTGVSINDSSTQLSIGRVGEYAAQYWNGYISNFRIVKGRCVYPSGTTFNPPTTPLTRTTGGTNPPQGTECSLLTCQSNRFLDSNGVNTPASSPLTITPNGSPTVVAFSPFNPTAAWSAATYGGSGYFDGNGDRLTLTTTSALSFGTGDWTIEFWVYRTDSNESIIYDGRSTEPQVSPHIQINPSGVALFMSMAQQRIAGTTVIANGWFHIAVSKVSGSTRLFVNGAQEGSTYSDSNNYTIGATLYIGGDYVGSANAYLNGYLSDLRVLKGTGYSSITVPTAPLTAITNTSLLLNFTNAGVYDATSKNDLETVGNAQISSTTAKWGSTSISFDGTGDWLLIPDQPPQRIGTGNFTVELWVYRNSSGTYGLVGKGTGTTGLLVSLNGSNQVVFTYGSSTITSSGTVSATTWTHIAVVREGTSTNQTKIYINGTNDGTGTVSTDFNQTNSMYIGADRTGGSAANAYVQDVRITNYARYTANFTAPTAAFPLQ